jgi:hypothetical protein
MGNQPGKPVNGQPVKQPHSLIQDNLKPKDSQTIELMAIAKGWLNESPEFDQVRRALINKVAEAGLKSTDPDLVIRSLRAIAQTEQRTKQLQLAAASLQMRKQQSELPEQINVNVLPAVQEHKAQPFEVIQELIKRNDVRAALDSGSANAAKPCAVV